jgi:hypothetical protein
MTDHRRARYGAKVRGQLSRSIDRLLDDMEIPAQAEMARPCAEEERDDAGRSAEPPG